jgi:cyanophycin synthetase
VADPVRTVELRVLDGPNLYFPRPAVKLTLDVAGWLRAGDEKVAEIARATGIRSIDPGARESDQRLRATARVAVQLTRRIAAAAGTERLGVRGRTGPEFGRVIVVFPWRRRGSAEALAGAVASGMAAVLRRSPERVIAELARDVAAADPGPEPTVPDPDVPVIQVSGTNGKTTTTRLLAHMVMTAGKRVAFSSTDGVYRNDRLVRKGHYSGFGGRASPSHSTPTSRCSRPLEEGSCSAGSACCTTTSRWSRTSPRIISTSRGSRRSISSRR